jgi:uncharacterized protein YjbI with pentapeptide repeats
MPDENHLAILNKGVEAWNEWREVNPDIIPDLSNAPLMSANLDGADLSRAVLDNANLRQAKLRQANLSNVDLSGADLGYAHLISANLREAHLRGADLRLADLREACLSKGDFFRAHLRRASLFNANLVMAELCGADLSMADLRGASLTVARLHEADLRGADLKQADLRGAHLRRADLSGAHLSEANLSQANLQESTMVETNFAGANLTGCQVYGIAAWDLNLVGAQQAELVITPAREPVITVDNLEVAQFIYLLLHNEKIRQVIETITSKAVLILGRFTPERKAVLDAIREELRRQDYVPILFDFEGPQTRDFTETIRTLAHLARFIIADLTEPSSLPKELEAIVPDLAVPVQPLLAGVNPYSMFQDYWKYPWMLPVYRYESLEGLMASLGDQVIASAEAKVRELTEIRRAQAEAQFTPRPAPER